MRLKLRGDSICESQKPLKKVEQKHHFILCKQRKDGKNQSSWGNCSQKEWDGKKMGVLAQVWFSDLATPYILDTAKLYTLKLRELSNVKSKYTMIMFRVS